MTWQDMHIGFDLGLQMLNSNLFNTIQKEGKDYLINKVISDLVAETVSADRQTVFNLESYDDIRVYSSLIEPLVKVVTLDKVSGDGTYDYAVLPKDVTPITSGFLYSGRRYKVTVAGTTNLTAFGSTSPPVVNTIFTCSMSSVASNALQVGGKYTILTVNGADYTNAGAANNMVGTTFIATGTSAGVGGTVTPLVHAPTWANTELTLVDNFDIYEYIASYSNVDYGEAFATGRLKKGETYKIVVGGTISGLTGFGASNDTTGVGYQFLCTTDGLPAWATSGVSMIRTKNVLNRLVKIQDIHNFLQHSYGTVTSSPLSVIADGKLKVYHNGKFNINYISLDYLIAPVKIDSVNNVDCNLPTKFHSKIVDLTVKYAMATSGNPNYSAMNNELTKNPK